MNHFNEETLTSTKIPLDKLTAAPNLFDVMQAFNDFLYTKYTRSNLSFCLVTYGDALLTKILPQEATSNSIKLA